MPSAHLGPGELGPQGGDLGHGGPDVRVARGNGDLVVEVCQVGVVVGEPLERRQRAPAWSSSCASDDCTWGDRASKPPEIIGR